MQRTGVFWPSVPSLVLVVRRTTRGQQVDVCAPFSFAQTGFGVRAFLLYKRPIDEILFASFRKDIIVMAQKGAVKGVEGAASCVGLWIARSLLFLLYSEKREKLRLCRF
jgi:hypothetical protein